MRFALLLSATLLLTACGHYEWVKPGGDPSTYGGDHYRCLQSASANAPPAYQTYEEAPLYDREIERVEDRCYRDLFTNKKKCYTEITREHPDPPRIVTTDLNEGHRTELYNACMGSLGWVKQWVEAK